MRLKDIRYWFLYRFHPKYRYHVVRFGEPGWYDRDHAMFLCCFKLLEEFMEGEVDNKDNVQIDWNYDPPHAHAIRELRSLYFWWKHQRDRDIDERSDLFNNIYEWAKKRRGGKGLFDGNETSTTPFFDTIDTHPDYQDYQNLNEYVDTIDQKQLKRLIEVREFMWT